MNKLNKILTCLSIAVIVISAITWTWTHEQSQASAASVTVLRAELGNLNKKFESYKKAEREQRIADQNRDRAIDLDKRIWLIEQRFIDKPMPITTKEELFRLKQELKELRR